MDADTPTDITHLVTMPGSLPKRWPPDADGWLPHGPCVVYRKDGSLVCEITYDRGVAHGPYSGYWSDGRPATKGCYLAGLKEGHWWYAHHDDRFEIIRFVAGREIVDWDAVFGGKGPWSDPPVDRPAPGPSVD